MCVCIGVCVCVYIGVCLCIGVCVCEFMCVLVCVLVCVSIGVCVLLFFSHFCYKRYTLMTNVCIMINGIMADRFEVTEICRLEIR